jgi:diaminohydroxyphosphoribosylaminopyrimidine deaminase/5-amino-6-(5-phosphoribosylamino)uracil reductase
MGLTSDEIFMQRCLTLALLGKGNVAPNPMVGAVLVHNDRIIGEGYHRQYGGPHAEVNCLASVDEQDLPLIPFSRMYVSLEPCAHFGKTPPCADLIIRNKIPEVIIGCRDPFTEVNGKGIEKLKAAGISVTTGILEEACRELNKRFFTFHTLHRPYIVLKWAQSADGKIASAHTTRTRISNPYTDRLVHAWRAEEMAIAVGTNTVLMDDPSLTTRLHPGHHPVRLLPDLELKLPQSLHVFDQEQTTIVFNLKRHDVELEKPVSEQGRLLHYQVTEDTSLVAQMVHACYRLQLSSVLVEGGARFLQSFIDEGEWDEARVITNEQMQIGEGLAAPQLHGATLVTEQKLFTDSVKFFVNGNTGQIQKT